MANFTNKNSQYIQSLVDYILDTKPYHSKLTEIVEEYQFFDDMHVHFEERSAVRMKINPTWLYNFFSSGDSTLRNTQIKKLHTNFKWEHPSNLNTSYGALKADRDENTDLALVPYVYSKKAFDGIGVADVLVERNGNRSTVEPLVEGLDFFQSHGSIQLQIKQIEVGGNFVPSWAETRDDDVISTASAWTRRFANDTSKTNSAIRQIRFLLEQIEMIPGITPAATAILNSILVPTMVTQDYDPLRNSAIADGVPVPPSLNGYDLIRYLEARLSLLSAPTISILSADFAWLNQPLLTNDYEPLLQQLDADGTPAASIGYTDWIGEDGVPPGATYVDETLSRLTPSMYFNMFSDFSVRESGAPIYQNVSSAFIAISNIIVLPGTPAGDTWTVQAINSATQDYQVFSSIAGYVGSFVAPASFSSGTISFDTAALAQPTAGHTVRIKNFNRLVFAPTAPLETWNVIKVNPLAYTRPTFMSTRYGYIEDQFGVDGNVTILDPSFPASTVILTAQPNGQYFDLSSTVEPLYVAVIQVGVPFNDGRLAFTIQQGSVQPFVDGDKFYIEIKNDPAEAVDLDLGYGYDLDSYDNPDLEYDISQPPGTKINFVFDTRFTDYNLNDLGLAVDQSAVSGRKWRLRAIPNLGQPIATLKKDGSGPSNSVDLEESTSGIAPDPALNAAPLYSMLGDANPAPDLRLYYASTFDLEYSDDDFNTTTVAANVPVGSSYSSITHGLSFNLQAGSKPFIAVLSDDGLLDPFVEGGDVFSFQVLNNPPMLVEAPVTLVSANSARLVMHGDGFHESLPAVWGVSFTSPSDYTVTGTITEGPFTGSPVPGTPVSGLLTTPGVNPFENFSFNRSNVHFTFVPNLSGFGAGDSFSFRTFSRKPSYLVHGSVSGWQDEAVVGESYWNGIIGFHIEAPYVQLFDDSPTLITPSSTNTWVVGGGTFRVNRIRFDSPSLIYTLTPTPIGSPAPTGWTIRRSDIGSIGHLSRNGGEFVDQYITIDTLVNFPAADVSEMRFEVTADDFGLWNAQDAVILRPAVSTRLPTADDFVLIDKRTSDHIGLNLNYDNVDTPPSMAPLAPETIVSTVIDTFTGLSNTPIEATSPEAIVLRNWIPLSIKGYDSVSSVAEFSDSAVRYVLTATGSGETIGVVRASGTNLNWPTELEWDLNFFSTYLPLNAESNIVTYGNGFNDKVHARISESVKFLVSGGALTTDFLFTDNINVAVAEDNQWTINIDHQESMNALVEDGPFGGFLAGYDNQPYDDETHGYDTGYPIVDNFLEAQQLAGILPQTPVQLSQTPEERDARLSTLVGMIGFYLVGGNIIGTSLVQFLQNLQFDSNVTGDILATTGIGIPVRGMGMDITIGSKDINDPATEGAAAAFQDALVVMVNDLANAFDVGGFDVGEFDKAADKTAVIYSGSLPPVPAVLPPIGTYADFETPLAVVGDETMPTDFQGRVFEINFRITTANLAAVQLMPTPQVFIWLPSWPAPQQVAVVQKIGVGKYQVSVPSATEAKLYLVPGP